MSSNEEFWAERKQESEAAYQAERRRNEDLIRRQEMDYEDEQRYGPVKELPFNIPFGFLIYCGAAFGLSLAVEYIVWGAQSVVVQVWRGFGWGLPVPLLAWMLGSGHIFSGLAGITLLLHWLLGKVRVRVLRNVKRSLLLAFIYMLVASAVAGFIVIFKI